MFKKFTTYSEPDTVATNKTVMAEIKKYKKGDVVYYLGRTRATVLGNTLDPGGINADEAVLFLKTAQGSSVVVPVAFQDEFISEKQIKVWQRGPLAKQ